MISSEGGAGKGVMALEDAPSAPVSLPQEARIRYNYALNQLELSRDTGPWLPFVTGTVTSSPYNCPSTINVLEAVRIAGDDAIDLAQADVVADRPVIGFVSSKPTTTSAIVQSEGELGGFTGLVAGTTYYLSETPGQITANAPTTEGSIVQEVGWARNPTTLVITIERDYVLL